MARATGGHRESFQERRERRAAVDDPQLVLDAAARYLETRSRSVGEVRRHLVSAGYRTDLVEGAVARLLELGMLDDEAFARAWAESRDRARPRGEHALRQELARKGIDRETVQVVLDERADAAVDADPDANISGGHGLADEMAAERLLGKRLAAFARIGDPRVRRQRAYALLARNGFDPETCRTASLRVLAQLGDDAGDVARDGEGDGDEGPDGGRDGLVAE